MKRALCGVAGCLTLALASPAFAEGRAAAAAERAYQDIDFPSTHELAQHALESGGATRQETARLYVLLGISAAAQGNAAEARQSFVAALAIDPALKLEKSLSPKIRDPYLEAQGYWSASSERLSLNAKPRGDADHLIVRLADPAALVAKIELRIGAVGGPAPTVLTLDRAPLTRVPLPQPLQHRDYELSLRALDRYGNVLAEFGAEADPVVVRAAGGSRPVDYALGYEPAVRSYLLPVVLGLTGLGATAAGVVFQVKREQAAEEWNGPGCETPGRTRLAQCSNIDSRIKNNERLAIGFYAGGAALLTGSVIGLIAGRSAPEPRASRASTLGCSVAGPGVSCAGSF
jgi:hypothetical protein